MGDMEVELCNGAKGKRQMDAVHEVDECVDGKRQRKVQQRGEVEQPEDVQWAQQWQENGEWGQQQHGKRETRGRRRVREWRKERVRAEEQAGCNIPNLARMQSTEAGEEENSSIMKSKEDSTVLEEDSTVATEEMSDFEESDNEWEEDTAIWHVSIANSIAEKDWRKQWSHCMQV